MLQTKILKKSPVYVHRLATQKRYFCVNMHLWDNIYLGVALFFLLKNVVERFFEEAYNLQYISEKHKFGKKSQYSFYSFIKCLHKNEK